MARIRSSRNDVMAGAMVLAAIVGAVTIVILIAGGLEFVGKHDYRVQFPLHVGVHGLAPGSAVHLGGRRIGSVKNLDFSQDASGEMDGIDVTISIEKDIALMDGVVAFLEQPLLGSTAEINFISLGTGPGYAQGEIPGKVAPPRLLEQAGYGQEEAARVRVVIQKAESIAIRMDEAVQEFRDTVLSDVRSMTGEARARSDIWFERADKITGEFADFSGKANELVDSARGRADQMEELLRTAQAYADDNRGKVYETIENARSVSAKSDVFMDRLNGEIADLAEGFLEDGRLAIDDARTAVNRVDGMVVEQTPNIRKSIANFRLASDSMRDTMNEVRRSPWRLLYRPDMGEVEYELMYDSARIYAGAVSDLRAASESLKAMIDTGGRNATRGETLEPMLDTLYSSFEKFTEAEEAFLDQVLGAQPAAGAGQE